MAWLFLKGCFCLQALVSQSLPRNNTPPRSRLPTAAKQAASPASDQQAVPPAPVKASKVNVNTAHSNAVLGTTVQAHASHAITAQASLAQARHHQANTALCHTAQAINAQANTAQAKLAQARHLQANTALGHTAQANNVNASSVRVDTAQAAQPAAGSAVTLRQQAGQGEQTASVPMQEVCAMSLRQHGWCIWVRAVQHASAPLKRCVLCLWGWNQAAYGTELYSDLLNDAKAIFCCITTSFSNVRCCR